MPRDPIPFATGDVSALAKSLRAQWTARATQRQFPSQAPKQIPSHVEMLNMLARAAGHRNFQQFRARGEHRPPEARPVPAEVDPTSVLRATRYFDPQGRLRSWPAQRSVQDLCLWGLWSRIPAGRSFGERQISDVLTALHLFGDPAILRRSMCHTGLMTRSNDGRDYRRIERAPSPEGAALIRYLRQNGQ